MMKFKNIYQETKEDVELSLLSLWAPGSHRMRPALQDLFRREPLMAEPVFQSIFPWETTQDPNWTTYLDAHVINTLQIGTAAGSQYNPYAHQTESWKELHNGNSIVVTSGTGSGKTECFMYPVLSDLYRTREQNGQDPVQAIFLYPLNALMQDQKERLGRDCQRLGLKFAVYNSSLRERNADVPPNPGYPNAEVLTRVRVRQYDDQNTSCPQILLTNPSMLEYMLVRDKDNPIFERSRNSNHHLKWIVIDEAHTYTGSAAVELAYLIKRVLQAFGVSRDDVQFICTSATIGDPAQPQQLLDYIYKIIGRPSPASTQALVKIDGSRVVSPLHLRDISNELTQAGVTATTAAEVCNLRTQINDKPLPLSRIWNILTKRIFHQSNTEEALELLDRLCEIKVGNNPLLMARGHFFMRNIEGIYACVNDHCGPNFEYRYTGFDYLTTYRGDGKCPFCGAPLLELVQCGDCKEWLLVCEENDNNEVRPSYPTEYNDQSITADDDDDDVITDGGTIDDGNWSKMYLSYYGNGRYYLKPHPLYNETRFSFLWDNSTLSIHNHQQDGPWITLQNIDGQLYCPTCAKGSGNEGRCFKGFHTSADWLNGIIAPSILKECAPPNDEWGKYIAFTDSRQGTAIYAKRFNADSEKCYARARLADELSDPNRNPAAQQMIILLRAQGMTEAQIEATLQAIPNLNGLPEYTLFQAAECLFNRQIYDHIDFEAHNINWLTRQYGMHGNIDDYKNALVRSIIGRRTVHLANIESLGLVTVSYPSIDGIPGVPNVCAYAGLRVEDWKDFLKICLDYVIRVGNHLQCPSYIEKRYLRDSDNSTPYNPDLWPSVQLDNQGRVKDRQHRLVMLLCAGLGIHDVVALSGRRQVVDNILHEAWLFLSGRVLSRVNAQDEYYNILDENGNHKYDGWFYLNMSANSNNMVCKLKHTNDAWVCPVTYFLLDTIFMGYSPSIKGCLCPENIQRFAIPQPAQKISVPKLRDADFYNNVADFKNRGLWTDRHKYAYGQTHTGYLTAEHSGQQNRDVLNHYTNEFKNHKLNLLQCSTTMEMGVDIGDIEMVLMTNIPPTSANYMQRAGRAGRRGQSKAAAYSLCRNTAIGMQAFQDPLRCLVGVNPAIQPIESNMIIQRHANSFFIRQFILDPNNAGVRFRNTDEWLNAIGHRYAALFSAWLANNKNSQNLNNEFSGVFGNWKSLSDSIDASIDLIDEIALDFQRTMTSINNAIAATNDLAKQRALSIQAFALAEQDLKKYLAENRFLPNADMPTGVVEFNHMSSNSFNQIGNLKDRIIQLRNQLSTPNLANAQRRQWEDEIEEHINEIRKIQDDCVSTREIQVALSEYAPGQTVVINERNYISEGIEWKNSLGLGNPWKYIYHCQNCGRYEYADTDQLTTCPNCNNTYRNILAPNNNLHCTYAIEPIRFRTDVNREINRRERTEKKAFKKQTILTNVDWANPDSGPMCDIVGNDAANGDIVFLNLGAGLGFSLCMDCGKMVVDTSAAAARNAGNWPHNDISHRAACPVNNTNDKIVLSGKFPTSFVSIRFFRDVQRAGYVDDEELLYSLGVILRRALIKRIGVDDKDLAFEVRQENGYYSLYIYDTCKGGCGYSTEMLDANIRNDVFSEAKQMLASFSCSCEKNISGACVDCLIDRESQRLEHSLSKFKLMGWFGMLDMNMVTHSSGAAAVSMPLQLLATKLINKPNTTSIDFVVNASDMNLNDWTHSSGAMGHIVYEASRKGKTVRICVAHIPSAANGNNADDIMPFVDLQTKFQNWGVSVVAIETEEVTPNIYSALIVNGRDHYFSDQADKLPFSEKWGQQCTRLFEDNNVPVFVPANIPTINDVLALMLPTDPVKTFTLNYCQFSALNVGNYFSSVIKPNLIDQPTDRIIRDILYGKDVAITFSDSYVNSALASLMLVYLVKEIKESYSFNISSVDLMFNGPKRNCNNPRWDNRTFISFNFEDEQKADDYTRDCFNRVLNITPVFSPLIPDHYRWIRFQPVGESSYVELRPDHGISGGWQSSQIYWNLSSLDDTTDIELKHDANEVYYLIIKR